MDPIEVRPISAAETRPLRQALLRPGSPIEELRYDGDDEPGSLHLGGFAAGVLSAIATYVRRAPPGESDPAAWQLRGMASAPAIRGRGAGRALLERGLAHVAAAGGTRLWCHARVGAAEFYRKCGFLSRGEVYEIARVGPHYFMWRAVPAAPPAPPPG